MAEGNRHLRYKDALATLEAGSPGAKHDFYFGFLERASERFRDGIADELDALAPCTSCGAPTPTEVCAFCRLVERAAGAQPVELVSGHRPGRRRAARGEAR